MNPRLTFELALRRHRWLVLLGLAILVALPAFAPSGFGQPASAIVAASDDGGRRNERHYHAFRAILIPHDELEARQNTVIDLALRHGLVTGRIDYGSERDEAGDFERATLSLPLRGGYADFQKFLAATLAGEPGVGVAELALQRDAGSNGVLVQLRLVFHVKPTEKTGS